MAVPIAVICDRCRAEGEAGEDPFAAFGALLDFEPVPRATKRADGWDEAVQRTYIAALSLTGADGSACRAVGRSAYGVTQLLAHEGSEGFRAAREQALAMAADERGRRLAEGLRAVAAEQAGWTPAAPPWANAQTRRGRPPASPPRPEPEPEETDEQRLEWLEGFVRSWLAKILQEREARLAGKIVAADFYLRQITYIEVMFDLVSDDALQALHRIRLDGCSIVGVAETPFTRLLDKKRREMWAALGEPNRPPPPPRDLLVDHGAYSSEPLESTRGGLAQSHEEQQLAFEERHARDAEAQIAWEAQAYAEAAEWARREAARAAQAGSSPPAGEGEPRSGEGEGAAEATRPGAGEP